MSGVLGGSNVAPVCPKIFVWPAARDKFAGVEEGVRHAP